MGFRSTKQITAVSHHCMVSPCNIPSLSYVPPLQFCWSPLPPMLMYSYMVYNEPLEPVRVTLW